MGLTELSDVVLSDVAKKVDGTNEQWCVCSPVVESEALMLAHLGGRFPRYLYNAAVQHFGEKGRRSGNCNAKQNKMSIRRTAAGGNWLKKDFLKSLVNSIRKTNKNTKSINN